MLKRFSFQFLIDFNCDMFKNSNSFIIIIKTVQQSLVAKKLNAGVLLQEDSVVSNSYGTIVVKQPLIDFSAS